MATQTASLIQRIIDWFGGEELNAKPKRPGITEAIERAANAEARLLIVEQATMSLTVGELPDEERDNYEPEDDEEDWFDED